MARVVLHYFRASIKHPFGHVSLTIPNGLSETNYLSFTSGEGLVTSAISKDQGRPNLAHERHIYGTDTAILLPDCQEVLLQEAIDEFCQLHREDYHRVIKNNTQAVARFLQQLGYIPAHEEFNEMLSQDVAKRVSIISINNIEKQRDVIKSLKIDPIEKIISLLHHDIALLEAQSKYYKIISRDESDNLTAHITLELTHLIRLGESARIPHPPLQINYAEVDDLKTPMTPLDQFYAALLLKQNRLQNQILSSHLGECLYYFPMHELSDLYGRFQSPEADNVNFYLKERKLILGDTALTRIQRLQILVENDINRLKAKMHKDRALASGKIQNAKKEKKIEKLEVLAYQLQESADYQGRLDDLLLLIQQPYMTGQSKTNLLQCVELFPYENLPQYHAMQSALHTLNALISDAERSQTPQGLFQFSSTKIERLRQHIPRTNLLERFTPKQIYDCYHEVTAYLQKKIKQHEKLPEKNKWYTELTHIVDTIMHSKKSTSKLSK
jgi:hypothetical protein